jgi:hypothetical protein
MRVTRLIPLHFVLAIAAGALFAPVKATAQVAPPGACPWLTQGMAARVLGGEVSVDVHVVDPREGSCSFVRTTDATISLKLDVSKSALPACGADAMKLKGIGNEAQRCASAAAEDRSVQKIASRVRDRFFTLTMAQGKSAAADHPGDLQNDDLEQAAESVAGNLF